DVAADHPSAFAARQLIMAHAALTELPAPGDPTAAGRLRHDQRIARAGFGLAGAAEGDFDVTLRGWSLRRAPDAAAANAPNPAIDATPLQARLVSDAGFGLDLTLQPTQPRLLQGEAGWSRKGPDPAHASLYVSEPQLRVSGRIDPGTPTGPARPLAVHGRAWLDHEWSESVLAPEAVGWDWIGMNLLDGGALTAFRLRRADGSALWAGGSWRSAGSATPRVFAPSEVTFTPLRHWRSPATGTRYPVEWRITTPAGTWRVRALLDAQELDSRASTGTIYWEGLSELLDASGQRIGLGYLELTGYAGALKL
ncbi:MAG: lipocalin family protein, partial [Leptothrix sp. (in: b-proteobacteria)]